MAYLQQKEERIVSEWFFDYSPNVNTRACLLSFISKKVWNFPRLSRPRVVPEAAFFLFSSEKWAKRAASAVG